MTKKEQYRLYFLVFSGCLYYLMAFTIPMAGGGVGLIAIVFSPIALGISLVSATLYYILLKKTNFMFLTELFSLIGVSLIVLTLLTFPYQ